MFTCAGLPDCMSSNARQESLSNFFCSFPPSSAGTNVLTTTALSHREAAVETDGSPLPVQLASREAYICGP